MMPFQGEGIFMPDVPAAVVWRAGRLAAPERMPCLPCYLAAAGIYRRAIKTCDALGADIADCGVDRSGP